MRHLLVNEPFDERMCRCRDPITELRLLSMVVLAGSLVNSTPITAIFEKTTLQKDIESNFAAEAQDLLAQSSIETESIYPRRKNIFYR